MVYIVHLITAYVADVTNPSSFLATLPVSFLLQ